MMMFACSRLVEDLADGAADHAFNPQPLLFFDRIFGRHQNCHEILRLGDPEHFDPAIGLGRAAGGEAQRDAPIQRCRRPPPDRCVCLAVPHVRPVLR